jgi:ankyrin repeat protein
MKINTKSRKILIGTFATACLSVIILELRTSDYYLVVSIDKGGADSVSRFLKNGGDPNRSIRQYGNRKSEMKLLHYLIKRSDTEACRILLESGADPNATAHGGITPLMCIFIYGLNQNFNRQIFDMLIYRSDITIQDDGGMTVLHYAAKLEGNDLYHELLRKCPDSAYIRDNNGLLPSDHLSRP